MTLTPNNNPPYGRPTRQLMHGEETVIRWRRASPRMLLRAATVLVASLVLSACKSSVDIPDVVREPEVVGEVLEVASAPEEGPRERRAQFSLIDDQVVVIDLNSARNLGGPEPREGQLLLYGVESDGPWFWSGPLLDDPRSGGQCAEIMAPALEDGDAIVFEIGLRLPKASDFDAFEVTDGQFTDPTKGFCVNERGEVTRYRS